MENIRRGGVIKVLKNMLLKIYWQNFSLGRLVLSVKVAYI